MGLFLEGVDSIVQPCTLPLLVFSVVFVVAGGRHAPFAAIAFLVGASAMAWARFAGVTSLDLAADRFVAGGLLVAAAAAVTGLASVRSCREPFVLLGAGAGGALAAAVWRPCVGAELGSVLGDAPQRGLGALAPIVFYVFGLGLLTLAFGLVPIAIPAVGDQIERPAVRVAAVAVGTVLGATIALGHWDPLVSWLLTRSTP